MAKKEKKVKEKKEKPPKPAKAPKAPKAAAPAGARGVMVEKPKADIYTVMLILSLVAVLIACLALYGEMAAYEFKLKA